MIEIYIKWACCRINEMLGILT